MQRKLNIIKLITAVFCFSGCATQSSYMPLVVTTSAADQEKFENDLAECVEYLESVEEDGRLAEVAWGAAVGTTVGVAGLGTVAGTGSLLGAAIFLPAAIVTGAIFARNKANDEEEALRAQVLNQCVEDRGYSIVEEAIDPN
jgi:hypothetical protein